ncbi:type IV pilus modification PilV family protein [Zavarzinella formosa]|uniref:type IV pilus modification PilV family protein n=1 Tax=Zavarzinella formosa TaxID=360055 RepID=UPI0002F65840|nr:prepilin-type N-terminal cleavage/methylation domain-containing protein [Zavarzinella formosa]
MTRNNTRPAVTLMEVLIAIFILSIGMVSVMAFFPIGALNMIRSVRDQRCSQLATNSNTMLHVWWKDCWLSKDGLIMPEEIASRSEPTIEALDTDPLTGLNILRTDTGPSHPVMIDPLGVNSYGTSLGGFITRTHLNNVFATSASRRNQLRVCTLPDDIAFDKNGEPSNISGQFDRGYRYSCAWMMQREHNSNPYDVRVYTLTFDNRPIDLPEGDQVFPSSSLTLNDPNSLTLSSLSNALPRTKKGGWIMVAYHVTYPLANAGVNFKPSRWVVSFHRTIAQEDALGGMGNLRMLTLEQPIQTPVNVDNVQVVVFEKLVEVFDRGTMSVADRSW